MEKDHSVVVIDVREEVEVATGIIERAIHVPLQTLEEAMNSLDKNKHYVMVCRSSVRSLLVAELLIGNGFGASNMNRGMVKW